LKSEASSVVGEEVTPVAHLVAVVLDVVEALVVSQPDLEASSRNRVSGLREDPALHVAGGAGCAGGDVLAALDLQ